MIGPRHRHRNRFVAFCMSAGAIAGARQELALLRRPLLAATDFLYRDELEQMLATGHLSRLDTAFSRSTSRTRSTCRTACLEHGAEFFAWLEQGATLYVCGDASRMAKDVDAALHQLIAQHGAIGAVDAEAYVGNLHDTNRYHRDVY